MKNKEDQLISKETAVLGEIIGYPFLTYPNVPTQTALQKWIREIHKIHLYIIPAKRTDGTLAWDCQHSPTNNYNVTYGSFMPTYASANDDSYEEALEKGLIKALNLIKNK